VEFIIIKFIISWVGFMFESGYTDTVQEVTVMCLGIFLALADITDR
jgi:hypothetical protein